MNRPNALISNDFFFPLRLLRTYEKQLETNNYIKDTLPFVFLILSIYHLRRKFIAIPVHTKRAPWLSINMDEQFRTCYKGATNSIQNFTLYVYRDSVPITIRDRYALNEYNWYTYRLVYYQAV